MHLELCCGLHADRLSLLLQFPQLLGQTLVAHLTILLQIITYIHNRVGIEVVVVVFGNVTSVSKIWGRFFGSRSNRGVVTSHLKSAFKSLIMMIVITALEIVHIHFSNHRYQILL